MVYLLAMKTPKKILFAMHGITRDNRNSHDTFDEELKHLGYIKNNEDFNNKIRDYAQTQNDEELSIKGVYQSIFLGKQLIEKHCGIQRIYCANHKRCLQTAQIVAKTIGYDVQIIVDDRLNARFYSQVAEQILERYSEMCYGKLPKSLRYTRCLRLYSVAASKFGVEPKNSFYLRLNSFLNDKKTQFDNSLIIAGRDVWDFIKTKKYPCIFTGSNLHDLNRCQIACVDFSSNIEQSFSKEQGSHSLNAF